MVVVTKGSACAEPSPLISSGLCPHAPARWNPTTVAKLQPISASPWASAQAQDGAPLLACHVVEAILCEANQESACNHLAVGRGD